MLRVPISICLAVVVALSATALGAGGREYAGVIKGTNNGKVSFKVVQQAAGPAVKGFKGKSVPLECASGGSALEFKRTEAIPVTGDRFAMTFEGAPKIEIAGRLKQGGKASGSLHVSPGTPGATCDSGVLSWTAERDR